MASVLDFHTWYLYSNSISGISLVSYTNQKVMVDPKIIFWQRLCEPARLRIANCHSVRLSVCVCFVWHLRTESCLWGCRICSFASTIIVICVPLCQTSYPLRTVHSIRVCIPVLNSVTVVVAVSCGHDTCFVVKTCDGLYHFILSIDRVGKPFGFQTMIWTFVRHPVSRCLTANKDWLLPVPT